MKQLARTGGRTKALLGVVTVIAATFAGATPAGAQVVQTPKNGCTSPDAYDGSLTSPTFISGSTGNVTFQGWLEVESVVFSGVDEAFVEYSLDPGPGQVPRTWLPVGRLKDLIVQPSVGGASDQPYSNHGLGVAPRFQEFSFPLPAEALNQTGVQIRFRFAAGDGFYQGFRGLAVDQISIDTFSAPLTEGFETSTALSWDFGPTTDGPNGPPSASGAPFWQILTNPQNVSVKNPEVNPELVTLPDSGALPAAAAGSRVAWFGHVDSGTFCGPDFAVRGEAPETRITDGPSGSTTSTDATFAFESSEPDSTFECSLDGAGFTECASPQSYSGLGLGDHTFQVQATDVSGSVDPTPATRTWTIVQPPPPPDTTPPDTAITSGPQAFGEDNTPTFTFSATEPGSRFDCSLDGGPFVPCSSPYTTARLRGGRHTLSVRAIDTVGNADPTPTVYVFEIALELADLPKPTLGREVNVQAVSGTVLVALPAGAAAHGRSAGASQKRLRYVPLEEAEQIPVGSYLDTKRGTVKLVSARGSGSKTQSGRFSRGIFSVGQTRTGSNRGLTTLKLRGGKFRRCRAGASASGGAASAAQLSKRTIRRLKANANGRFRSSGRHSAGTTRGTAWVTLDRCDGTLTKVTRGKLSVRDFRRKRTITVRAGKSYLARAPVR